MARRSESVSTTPDIQDNSPGIELGSFASGATPATLSKLIIATYNIRYAVGSFLITGSLLRRVRLSLPHRRASLVERHLSRAAIALKDGRRLPPVDILALQETDKETARAGRHHIARELASALSMNYASATAGLPRDEEQQPKQWYLDFEEHIAPDDTGDTGIALLSRLPLAKTERLALPWTECAWRPRLALAATIEVGSRQLHLFNSHIDPHASIEGQLEQHRAILDCASQLEGPIIMLGDFNTLSRRSCVEMRRLLEAEGFTTPFATGVATWRAGLIRLHTDWIFVRGIEVTRWGVARGLGVSDHWPVWVEVNMEKAV
ncbi:MAG TPA: endonuclease/exonuclease/phosphatase family protein [Pyrinomonadaceae bacterium]|jgi:endonuclease/exonuclease/phosphatase family metal-dependent hydrolase